jgi:2'-5' RNA ligase
VRLFVAICLPETLRPEAFEAMAPLRRVAPSVRWVQPDTLHITLKFLGQVPDSRAPEVKHSLRRAARGIPAFPLQLGGVGAFPNLRRPRVFWLGAQAAALLLQLQASVEDHIEPLGFPREARPFHPHVTLGRVGPDAPAAQLVEAERAAGLVVYEPIMRVQSVELMESRTTPGGARYGVLERVPLLDES